MATPDWLANIQNGAWQSQNPANAQQMYLDPTTNKWVMPLMRGAQEGFNTDPGQAAQATVSGYRQYDNLGKDANSKDYNGHQYVDYDTAGTQNGGGTFNWMGDSSMQDLMKGALVMAGTYGLGTALAGAGGAAGGAGGAGGGVGGGAGGGTFNAAMDSQLANAALGPDALSGYTAAGAGGITASPIAAGSGLLSTVGGGLSSLASGLGGSGLGTLATVAGGLLGSQKNKVENSSTKTMDPRLDGPVFGQDGIVPRSQALLAQQMSPEAQKQWLDMQKTGQGLLAGPVAGNGFNRYYK